MELLIVSKRKRCKLPVLPCCIVLGLITNIFLTSLCSCRAATFKPDQIKAAFIYNLTNFVTLPQTATPDDYFVIGILGNKNIAQDLEVMTRGEKIKGRPFSIKFIKSPSEIENCHVLFVDESQGKIQPGLLKNLANRGILTIGDTDEFLKNGGIIGLLPRQNRIQIVINMVAAHKAGILFNSKLLKVARVLWPQDHMEAGQW